MTALNKKRKCRNTGLYMGGEKRYSKLKRDAMFHKRDRVNNKKLCKISDEE